MDNRDWEILDVLYNQKNITKTAQILFFTQPALTKRIMQIEAEFNVKIVNRGVKGVSFTPQGEFLAQRASEMITAIRSIKDDVLNMSDEVAGTLRLGVSNFFSKYKLPGLLKQFKQHYPQVDYQVETGFSKDIFNLVYNHNVHIGFVRGDYSWPGKKHLLYTEEILVISTEKITLEDLPNIPRVDYHSDYLYKSLIDRWWSENYIKPPLVAMKVDRGDTCREMVLNGLGYAIMPSMFADGLEDINKIEIMDNNGQPLTRKTWMFYHEQSLEKRNVKAFVDLIINQSTRNESSFLSE